MGKKRRRSSSPLQRRARRGRRGHPVASVAYYGPNDQFASKVVVGIVGEKGDELLAMEKWFSKGQDVRLDPEINTAVLAFIDEHDVKSVGVTERIIGCPHEEGIDYPEGESCPECPFWAGRDRFTSVLVHEDDGEPSNPIPRVD